MPEALENQHRCGYTPPPPSPRPASPSTMALECEAHRCWSVQSEKADWTLRTASGRLAIQNR